MSSNHIQPSSEHTDQIGVASLQGASVGTGRARSDIRLMGQARMFCDWVVARTVAGARFGYRVDPRVGATRASFGEGSAGWSDLKEWVSGCDARREQVRRVFKHGEKWCAEFVQAASMELELPPARKAAIVECGEGSSGWNSLVSFIRDHGVNHKVKQAFHSGETWCLLLEERRPGDPAGVSKILEFGEGGLEMYQRWVQTNQHRRSIMHLQCGESYAVIFEDP